MQMAVNYYRGRWNVRCGQPARRSRASLRTSAITICGTTSPACSSLSGADVKTVQARPRHASAKTTLDTYGHIWPDRDESTRAAIEAVITARAEQGRNGDEAVR